jgi:hypothetical protein
MSEGEEKLHARLFNAGLHPVDIDLVISVLRSDDYFVYNGVVREVEEIDWIEYADGATQYTVWTESV